jgi:hypothetical protein
MVARCDPTKCKYFPEEIPEAIAITAAASTASGTSIASYASFSPYVMSLKKMWTSPVTSAATLRLDIDSGHAVIESPLTARSVLFPSDIDLIAQENMDLWGVGVDAANFYFAYTARVTKPTIFEKIKHSITLTDDEKTLADEFDIKRKFLAGILGARGTNTEQFKKIYEVARSVTVVAAGSTRVGRIINVKRGEKAVLLGMSVDNAAAIAVGANDTYFTLNRDVSDTAHIKLDCASMPPLNYGMTCYIPALDKHEILIESVTGIAAFDVRYIYGVANLTLMEKIRWGQKDTMTADEKKTADEFDLYDSVEAGVL